MSFIIRDRIWTGYTTLDGNNPFTIQGHPIANRVQSESTIRDYQDLTSHLGVVPQELEVMRQECKLLGGSHVIRYTSEPIGDYLRREKGIALSPTNRQVETPDITIGKAGTIDVKHKNGSIYLIQENETKEELEQRILENISIIYNYGDYDDPYAPVAEDIGHNADYSLVKVTIDRMPPVTMKGVTPERQGTGVGRVVARVRLTDGRKGDDYNADGLKRVQELVRDMQELNVSKYKGALHIENIHAWEVWTEILLVETPPKVGSPEEGGIIVSGAKFKLNKDHETYVLLHPWIVHPWMDLPAYRAVLFVPLNYATWSTTEESKKAVRLLYGIVPIWDYTKRAVTWENGMEQPFGCTIAFGYTGNSNTQSGTVDVPIVVDVVTGNTGATINETNIANLRISPIIPVPLSYAPNRGQRRWYRHTHPLINYDVLPPFKVEAFLEGTEGYHFICRLVQDPNEQYSVTYKSLWTGTEEATNPSENGEWRPGAYATITIVCKDGDENWSPITKANVMWQGLPIVDRGKPEIVTNHLRDGVGMHDYWDNLKLREPHTPIKLWTAETPLPAGLSLFEGGYISGEVNAIQDETVRFSVTDVLGRKSDPVMIAMLIVEDGRKPVIRGEQTFQFVVGRLMEHEIQMTSQGTNYARFALSPNSPKLPDGLRIDEARGIIKGVARSPMFPTQFIVTAENDWGEDTAVVTIFIIHPDAPTITTETDLGEADRGAVVSIPLIASGDQNLTWETSQPSLPKGLTLTPYGLLYGIIAPDAETREYKFLVVVRNSFGLASQEFKLTVNEA